jgi:hypothetical protein
MAGPLFDEAARRRRVMEYSEVRSIVVGVFWLGCLACMPQRELSSYGEGEAPELDRAVDDGLLNSGTSGPAASRPAAPSAAGDDGEATPPMPTAAVDEAGPSNAPVDPTTMTAAGDDPAGSEPASDDAAGSEPSGSEPSGNDGSRTVSPTDVDAAAACATMGGFTIAATSSCYMLGDNVFTWQDARSFCQAWGGDLVQIDSLEENLALAQAMDESAWIGATDQDEEGIFRWAGGAPLTYAGWSANQPNNLDGNEDCTELRSFDERWSDVPCTGDVTRRALCERT